jgi:hypothetical protein
MPISSFGDINVPEGLHLATLQRGAALSGKGNARPRLRAPRASAGITSGGKANEPHQGD